MAGAILISSDTGASMSSLVFDHILESIKANFLPPESEMAEGLYKPYEEQGMMFISLMGSSADEFQAFCRATLLAKANNQGSIFELYWEELCEKLASDPRFAP